MRFGLILGSLKNRLVRKISFCGFWFCGKAEPEETCTRSWFMQKMQPDNPAHLLEEQLLS